MLNRYYLFMKKVILFCILILFAWAFSCSRDEIIHENGYIIFDDLEFFQFVPTKNLNLETSISSFYSQNLMRGIQFMSKNKYYDTLVFEADTFHIENRSAAFARDLQFIKIVPVHIDYKILSQEQQIKYPLGLRSYSVKIRGRVVKFIYDNTTIDIIRISPFKVKKRNKMSSMQNKE